MRRRVVRPNLTTFGFALFGLLYFVSLPFILAPSGAEGRAGRGVLRTSVSHSSQPWW